MKKIVLVISHYNRIFQLRRTLESILLTKHDNLYVVVLDYNSDNKQELFNVILDFPYIELLRIPKDPDNWYSCIVPYNMALWWAIKKYKPEIVMMQDAECYHVGDVILHANYNTDNNYIAYGTFSSDKETTFDPNFKDNIENIAINNTKGAWGNGVLAWYNHPEHRRVGYGFCGAMSTENMVRINGFDERYKDGVAFGDDDFVKRIGIAKINTIVTSYPFVVHQWHYDESYNIDENSLKKNRDLYSELASETNCKAKHIYSPDFTL